VLTDKWFRTWLDDLIIIQRPQGLHKAQRHV